ncbi:ribonuclease H, partial [Trifolium medium]|nr:ribonuclease H [Trifolium medium]
FCYAIWGWRNKEHHDPEFRRPVQQAQEIERYVHAYGATATTNNIAQVVIREERTIQWQPPKEGWVSLNTDRVSKNQENSWMRRAH